MNLPASIAEDLLSGSRLALSRALTCVENGGEAAARVLQIVSGRTGKAIRVGVTGPPGAGKSSLVTSYVKFLRKKNHTVAVIAVDPTSPFSGGALLGDRVRMNSISLDPGVFVRSLATRGDLGGLTQSAGDMADVLDGCGFDYVLLETVGVGQSELEIVQYADTTVVVLVPESGDSIQGMKAGLMEIADVFAVNKSDREGADRFVADLRSAMHLKEWTGWSPPMVMTVATKDGGIEEFHQRIEEHLDHLRTTGDFARRRELRTRLRTQRMIDDHLLRKFWSAERVQAFETAIRSRRSPHDIASEFTREFD